MFHLIRFLFTAILLGTACYGARVGTETRAEAIRANLPLTFESNAGQASAEVKFLARLRGYAVLLSSDGAALQFSDSVLRMKLQGAISNSKVHGTRPLAGKVNYFIGADPAKWLTDIPTFTGVRYDDVYPGVNVDFHGAHGKNLEFDFILSPNTNASVIRLRFDGADSLEIDSKGGLQLRIGGSAVKLTKPVAYQSTKHGRGVVAASYVLLDSRTLGFQLGQYDQSLPLIIDPVIEYASYIGGSGIEGASSIAVDTGGNVYLTGQAWGPSEFPLVNPLPGFSKGNGGFVAKLNSSGTALVYSTYLGGLDSWSQCSAIAVDAAGNAYITGWTQANDFPTKSPIQKTLRGRTDAFVVKLNSSGNALVYGTYMGGPGYDYGRVIAVDAAGNALVAGTLDPNPQTPWYALTHESGFIAKLNPAGSALIYSKDLSGTLGSTLNGIAVDGGGNAFVTGSTRSPDFPLRNPMQRASFHTAFASGDKGANWGPIDSGLPARTSILQVDPQSSSTLYAVGQLGVYRSIDAGVTWQASNNGITNQAVLSLTIDANAPSTLYATSSWGGLLDPPGGVYKTTNGGGSWKPLAVGGAMRVWKVAVDPSNSNILYAAAMEGLMKSTDGGANWTPAGLRSNVLWAAVDPHDASTIYAYAVANGMDYSPPPQARLMKSSDGGDHWEVLEVPQLRNPLIFDPENPQILYAQSAVGIIKSDDGGLHWTMVREGVSTSIVLGAGSPAVLYSLQGRNVISSMDRGITWRAEGTLPIYSSSLLAADVNKPGKLYADGSGCETFLTKLSGAGEIVYSTFVPSIRPGGSCSVGNAVAVDSEGNAYVAGRISSFVPDLDSASIQAFPFVLKVSADGSRMMQGTNFGGGEGETIRGLAVDGDGNGYIVGSTVSAEFPVRSAVQPVFHGVVLTRSGDGGADWTRASEGLTTTDIRAIAGQPQPSRLFTAGAKGVYTSQDAGKSWKATGLARSVRTVVSEPATPDTVYAAGADGIFQSIDAGGTWTPVNSGLDSLDVRALAIDAKTPSTLFAGTADGIYRTRDRGATWARVNPGLRAIRALTLGNSIVYAVGVEGVTTVLARSDDGGEGWTSTRFGLFDGNQIDSLVVDASNPSRLFVLAGFAVYRSTDSGANWKFLQGSYFSCEYLKALAIDYGSPATIYAGGESEGRGCILRSQDGGDTWTQTVDEHGFSVLGLTAGEPGVLYASMQPLEDAFLVKLTPAFETAFATYLGGTGTDQANAVALDSFGNLWVAGITNSLDFPTVSPLQSVFGGPNVYGGGDVFVLKLRDK